MAETSRIDGFDVGIDAQSPRFFSGDVSKVLGIDLGLDSKQPMFYNDDSTQLGIVLGTEAFKDSFVVLMNPVLI